MDIKNANGYVGGTVRLFKMECTANIKNVFGLANNPQQKLFKFVVFHIIKQTRTKFLELLKVLNC